MPTRDYYLPQRNLVSQEDAATIENARIPRSRFVGSFSHKTTFNAGQLIPFLVEEILPGDHMAYDVTAYIRMSTPLFPLFDSQRVDTFFFFVPNRILWTSWVALMGETPTPSGDPSTYAVPLVSSPVGGYAYATIFDYMGLPTADQVDPAEQITHNVLPLRAYNRIWNDWFRDQNLQTKIAENVLNGPDNAADYTIKERAKSHDYFTSALPWPQKFTAPNVPVAGIAPVQGIGISAQNSTGGPVTAYETLTGGANYANYFMQGGAGDIYIELAGGAGTWLPAIYADLSAATGVNINTFRQAFLIQELLERDARGGTRYVELLRSHFGVISPDFRLQRPEYIGGGQTPLNITPIAQTAPTTGVPVGALGAAGTAAGQHRASYAATEHGYIIGLINVRSELSYQQGLHKMWRRSTRYDFYLPALAGLGEQAILREEIYARGTADDGLVFGYQERWHEYRTRYSYVTGLFKSTTTGAIDQWHLAQEFSAAPTLNGTFITDTPPMTRVLAAGASADFMQYLADINIKRVATRAIPTYGTPVTLGRF